MPAACACVYVCMRAGVWACVHVDGRVGGRAGGCTCVRVCQTEKRVPDEWQARQAKIASAMKRKVQNRKRPFRQSSHCHPDKRKRERLSTKSTHVTVYLFRDLNRDRSRLLWMTVGPKGRYSAKRRTRKRYSSKHAQMLK